MKNQKNDEKQPIK